MHHDRHISNLGRIVGELNLDAIRVLSSANTAVVPAICRAEKCFQPSLHVPEVLISTIGPPSPRAFVHRSIIVQHHYAFVWIARSRLANKAVQPDVTLNAG